MRMEKGGKASDTQREQEVLKNIVLILERYLKPNKIILFGSRAAGTNEVQSDFDIAVDASKPEFKLVEKLNEELDHASGLYSVDVVYLPECDQGFRDIVLKGGKVIYER